MGIDSANGEAKWDPGRNRLEVNWDGLVDDPIYKEIRNGMEWLGDAMAETMEGGTKKKKDEYLVLDPMRQLFGQETLDKEGNQVGKLFALHPLGGCPMETYPRITYHLGF